MANKTSSAYRKGVDLTLKQRAFVTILVRQGCNPTQAARQAGYVEPKVASYDLLRIPHVQEAVRQERARYISGDLANVATGTLRAIMTDESASASARVAAARTVLELAGELGSSKRDHQDDGPLSEMTADQLAQLIDRWQGERSELANTIDADDVTMPCAADSSQLLQ